MFRFTGHDKVAFRMYIDNFTGVSVSLCLRFCQSYLIKTKSQSDPV